MKPEEWVRALLVTTIVKAQIEDIKKHCDIYLDGKDGQRPVQGLFESIQRFYETFAKIVKRKE